MGTVPTLSTVSAGAVGTAAMFNAVKAVADFDQSPPECMAYHSTLQSLTNNTWAVVALQSEVFDVPFFGGDSPMHDNVTNNSRIFIRTTGKYEVTGMVGIASNATGIRAGAIRSNAAGAIGSGNPIASPQVTALNGFTTTVIFPVVIVPLTAGDYIELFAYQNSGGALNTATGIDTTWLRCKWIAI